MGIGFKHGGSTPLNFKVISGQKPETAPENTIWVDTDEKIHDYCFSAVRPLVKVCNIIDFPSDRKSVTERGVTYTLNEDDTFSFHGTLTSSGDFKLLAPMTIKNWSADKKYTLTVKHIGGTATLGSGSSITFGWGIFRNDAKVYFRGSTSLESFPEIYRHTASGFDFENSSQYLILYFQCWRPGTVFENYRVQVILEEGSTPGDPNGTAENGTVWFATNTSSPVAFNALKKNDLQVCPISAMQYVDGAWVRKTAMSYQDGAWKEWITYAYYSGDKCEAFTGGWTNMYESATPAQFTDAGIFFPDTTAISATYAVNKVDATNFSRMTAKQTIHVRDGNAPITRVGLHTKNTYNSYSNWVAYTANSAVGEYDISIDLTGITGEYYVGCLRQHISMTVDKIGFD